MHKTPTNSPAKPPVKSSLKRTKNRKANGRNGAELQERLYRAELLLDLSQRIASLKSLDEILNILVEITTRELLADRGSILLNDESTGELYSRVAQGDIKREIRILNNSGIAGYVFTSGVGEIVKDAYSDERFNKDVDEQTGYETTSILCAPIRTANNQLIGVAQILNRQDGDFTPGDLELLEAMTGQAAIALESQQFAERMEKSRIQEREFLDVVADVTSEIDLKVILGRVMGEAMRMLQADRSTLFLNDEKTSELFAMVGEGLQTEIRLPNHVGIAGTVFTSGQTVNIPHAYADLRFNPGFDKQTGYFTRSILCVPVISKEGKMIGVTQCLNKRGGAFTSEDEQRLRAFTSQVAVALENAKLFDDIQNIKNYNESMLESMSNGVLTFDEDEQVVTCNAAGQRILQLKALDILKKPSSDVFKEDNAWVIDRIKRNEELGEVDVMMDAELKIGDETVSTNLTFQPLVSTEGTKLGSMIMIEDISAEKRMKSTMSRYMDPSIADQLMGGAEDMLGGKSTEATVLFSDIRGFTPLTEALGPQGTVSLLNEYFTIMVECISDEDGMLDKFIGDAIMAGFGIPLSHDDDPDRAVRAAIAMTTKLQQWNDLRIKNDQMPVGMGVGLNTDTVVSGNIGSPKRMDYTMIGDGVNLAARLESACKQYAAKILLSEFTHAKLKTTYRMRDIDLVVVKGKTQPVRIFELLDYHSEESFPNLMNVLASFREGMNEFRSQRWKNAEQAFQACLEFNPGDKLSEIYVDRCRYMESNPPGDDWDGRWVMTEK
jgi:adenylate cyclase